MLASRLLQSCFQQGRGAGVRSDPSPHVQNTLVQDDKSLFHKIRFAIPTPAAISGWPGRVWPDGRKADPTADSTKMPAAPAVSADAPARWFPRTPAAGQLEPACAKSRLELASANKFHAVPGAHSKARPAVRPDRADCEFPSDGTFPETVLLPVQQAESPQANFPAAQIPCLQGSRLHREIRGPQGWRCRD